MNSHSQARLRRALSAVSMLAALGGSGALAADMNRVLHVPFVAPENGFDPQATGDLYSNYVNREIFDPLYRYDYLARPYKVVPNTAAALPDISADGLTWTIKVKPGIYFSDDPAFKGKKRELTAQDYVYSITRILDPNLRTGGDVAMTDLIVGARPIVDAARKPGGKLDYDAPIAGLRAIDRYTLQIKLTRPDYTLLERLAGLPAMAVAREAIEAAGADVMSHPVGTGPYRLKEWKKATRVVLEANPNYRDLQFPESGNPRHRAVVQSMRGKTLPQIGRIEISIIEESQSSLLAFAQGNLDYVGVAGDDLKRVLVGTVLEPELARKGVIRMRYNASTLTFTYFNMNDPLVGGYSNAQIALRRAIAMGFNVDELIRVLYGGEALPANQLLPPGVDGHDDSLAPKSIYDPDAARALLDRFGFKDRDGDGYRETPDGKPLTLVRGTLPESWYRELDTLWKKNMDAIGIRMQVVQKTFSELVDMSRAGKLMMFHLAYRSLEPSGYQILQALWSREPLDSNPSQFANADYDRVYEQFLQTPAGPGRVTLARRMSDISQAYVPMQLSTFGIGNTLVYPWVEGYWPSQFGFSWKYLDIDLEQRKAAAK